MFCWLPRGTCWVTGRFCKPEKISVVSVMNGRKFASISSMILDVLKGFTNDTVSKPSYLRQVLRLVSLFTFGTEADKGHELSFQVVAFELSLPSSRFYSWRDIILFQCERGGWGYQKKFKNLKEVCYTLLVC